MPEGGKKKEKKRRRNCFLGEPLCSEIDTCCNLETGCSKHCPGAWSWFVLYLFRPQTQVPLSQAAVVGWPFFLLSFFFFFLTLRVCVWISEQAPAPGSRAEAALGAPEGRQPGLRQSVGHRDACHVLPLRQRSLSFRAWWVLHQWEDFVLQTEIRPS